VAAVDTQSFEGLPVRPGDVVAERYRIDGVIGAGGMGVVVAAHHLVLDAPVALKLLRPEAVASEERRKRFEREAKAALAIHSEHVARVLDMGNLTTGEPFIVLEHLEGETLAALVARRGALPIAEAADYALEACEALAEAHRSGVVHRDVKPSNLFLARREGARPTIKVLDFGIAKTFDDELGERSLTGSTAVLGSHKYMSPEQLRGSRDVSARADLWSLGVTIFELVSGRLPFESDSAAELSAQILRETAPRLTEIVPAAPAELADVLARCLEREPSKRFAGIAELARALAPFGTRAAALSAERIARMTPKRPGAATTTDVDVPAHDATRIERSPSGGTVAPSELGPPAVAASRARSRSRRIAAGIAIAVAGAAGLTWSLYRFVPGESPAPGGSVAVSPSVESTDRASSQQAWPTSTASPADTDPATTPTPAIHTSAESVAPPPPRSPHRSRSAARSAPDATASPAPSRACPDPDCARK
jgi:serine/threonine-protein kinase